MNIFGIIYTKNKFTTNKKIQVIFVGVQEQRKHATKKGHCTSFYTNNYYKTHQLI